MILGEWALPPKDLYPDLFVCSVSMEALICDVLISSPDKESSSLESTVIAICLLCSCCMRTGHGVHLGHSCMRPSLFLFIIIFLLFLNRTQPDTSRTWQRHCWDTPHAKKKKKNTKSPFGNSLFS